jgi:hypothetical protein
VLGTGREQASPQRRWQVTGLRVPWVSPAMGRRRGRVWSGVVVTHPTLVPRGERRETPA